MPKLKWKRQNKELFYKEIDERANTISYKSDNHHENLKQWTDLILDFHKYNLLNYRNQNFVSKQDWFDRDCEITRSRLLHLLNIFRETESVIIKGIYLNIAREYKQLCSFKNFFKIQLINLKMSEIQKHSGPWFVLWAKAKSPPELVYRSNLDCNLMKIKWLINVRGVINTHSKMKLSYVCCVTLTREVFFIL